MAQTSDERRIEPKESWMECTNCGAQFMTWSRWYGSTLWVRDGDGMVPVPKFRFCPNCGARITEEGERP